MLSFTDWGIAIISPSCQPRCTAVHQRGYRKDDGGLSKSPRPRAVLPSSNAGTGRMTLGYRHHLALVPTSLYPPSTNAGTGRMTVGYRHHLACQPRCTAVHQREYRRDTGWLSPSSRPRAARAYRHDFFLVQATGASLSSRPRANLAVPPFTNASTVIQYRHPCGPWLSSSWEGSCHREIRHFTCPDHAKGA